MPYFESYAEVEVDIDEFMDACNKKEIKEVIEWLFDNGHLSNIQQSIPEEKRTLMDKEWMEISLKLSNIRLQLTSEDESKIREILKKY